jgi:tetratricopeptide (TPR) repeat protein
MKPKSTYIAGILLCIASVIGGAVCAKASQPALLGDNIYAVDSGEKQRFNLDHPDILSPILSAIDHDQKYASITIDYPFDNTVFPPDMVAPTFLWHDSQNQSDRWLIDISFDGNPYHIYSLTEGKQAEQVIDQEAISPTNEDYKRSDYDISAKAWTPDEDLWQIIKNNSRNHDALVTVYGMDTTQDNRIVSTAHITIQTSLDPVGAPIFYRDVPLMPKKSKNGKVKPIDQSAMPLITWRLRDISKQDSPAVLKGMPTCANCHSFSADGNVLGMDLDGPQGDKGAYALTDVAKDIVIESDDIITWNSYKDTPQGHSNFGLFSQVSPDGRYVVSTLNEATFVVNYPNFGFLQSFYPTRGILVVYDRQTGKMTPLPGAADPEYVQTNGNWSPDGKRLVFSRAKAKDKFESEQMPEYAGDDRETFIQYDLYTIPFNDGKGGIAKPVTGASKNGMSNSFPKFSPDGKWIVFVKSQKGQLLRPDSRLHIIPAEGGEAREMNCNLDTMNSWHSWSPSSRWLVFSSKGLRPFTQMFLTHIDEDGNDSPAVLIPNATADNRAVNIPEFLNGSGDAIASINAPTQEAYRYYKEAQTLIMASKWTEAETVLDESIRVNPYYGKAHNAKGIIQARLHGRNEAIKSFQTAIEVDPDLAEAYFNLAMALKGEGRIDEAVSYLEKMLVIDENNADNNYLMAELLILQGNQLEAISYYEKCMELEPDNIKARTKLAAYLVRQGQISASFEQYEAILKLDPQNINALNSVALFLSTHPSSSVVNPERALKLACHACELTNNEHPGLLDTLAVSYAATGDYDQAAAVAQKALDLARSGGHQAMAQYIETHMELFKKNQPVKNWNLAR